MRTHVNPFSLGVLLVAAAWTLPFARATDGREARLPPGLRVRTPIDLEHAGRQLDEVLGGLSGLSGVSLRTAGGLEGQKVTVLVRRMPLSDAVLALGAAVDGVWEERLTGSGRIEYVLVPSDRRAERLARFRQTWADVEARCVEMVMAGLERRLTHGAAELDPSTQRPELTSFPEPLFPLAQLLPRSVIRRVVREGSDAYNVGGRVGADKSTQLYVPVAMLGEEGIAAIRRFYRTSLEELRAAGVPEERLRAGPDHEQRAHLKVLEFWTLRNPERNRLAFDLFLRVTEPGQPAGYDTKLASSEGPPIPDYEEPREFLLAAGGAWGSHLEKQRAVTLPSGSLRSDYALLEVALAAGINLVADHYTRGIAYSPPPGERALTLVLDSYEAAYRSHPVCRFWLGETLVVRSLRWPYASEREPPAKVTDRWDGSRRAHGSLLPNDYVAAAKVLLARQIPVLMNHLDREGNPHYRGIAQTLARHRHALRGWAALTPQQQRQAVVAPGLALLRTIRQHRTWREALLPFELLFAGQRGDQLRLLALAPQEEHPIPKLLLAGLPHVRVAPLAPACASCRLVSDGIP